MSSVVIAFHSGYGHTRKVAEGVVAGAASVAGTQAVLLDVSSVDEAGWARLAAADAIVFGAPTYMGGPSAQFKMFADESAKPWFSQMWKDKIAGGFTCSLNLAGDKYSTLMYFVTLAMQHGLVWVGLAMHGARSTTDPEGPNRIGSFIGVAAQADNVSPELSPPPSDIETARRYGRRIAEFARTRAQMAGRWSAGA
jgi:NAD(P)H dehydrogenase (quinone)